MTDRDPGHRDRSTVSRFEMAAVYASVLGLAWSGGLLYRSTEPSPTPLPRIEAHDPIDDAQALLGQAADTFRSKTYHLKVQAPPYRQLVDPAVGTQGELVFTLKQGDVYYWSKKYRLPSGVVLLSWAQHPRSGQVDDMRAAAFAPEDGRTLLRAEISDVEATTLDTRSCRGQAVGRPAACLPHRYRYEAEGYANGVAFETEGDFGPRSDPAEDFRASYKGAQVMLAILDTI